MSIKIIFSAISVIIGLLAFLPYLKSTISKKTKPHAFTWLIWGITQGTASVGLWVGGGGIGAISLTIGTVLVFVIFFMSLKHGEKNITKSDKIVLTLALSAIAIWLFLDNPFLAVLLVSLIDVSGYIPTFRKSYNKPWTENPVSWGMFTFGNIFAILALANYNFLTLSYITAISSANIILLIFLITRRRQLSKKKDKNEFL
jgi:hypothetical protein